MKKSLIAGVVLAMVVATTSMAAPERRGGTSMAAPERRGGTSMAAPARRGGFMGGLHGCLFGLRGAAAYNDGKNVVPMEWVNAFTFHIWSAIQGWQGTTTADLRAHYGSNFF